MASARDGGATDREGGPLRELWLLRHAKSAWDVPGLDDHDRDLAPRGLEAAPRIGRRMAELALVPDLVLCSTARRAARTWELVAAALPRPVEVRHQESLYLASPAELLRTVREQPDGVHRLLLVGHDPGLHRLALLLVGEDSGEALASGLLAKFPTGALCRIGLEVEGWAGVDARSGRLLAFLKPRELD
jgi:phosphohistidine phosphatase